MVRDTPGLVYLVTGSLYLLMLFLQFALPVPAFGDPKSLFV